ncbi:hypothetical protein CPC08DRAFT_653274 [Agrocybe pediades]|nr:hypothetical protein CPC08DRAFT_653274 [Agrocybe pediades]
MSHRYAPLPNPTEDRQAAQRNREDEMQAAFDYSDDEDEHNTSESHPLNPTPTSPSIVQPPPHTPGTYNFESVDYDYPPPGSPPPPSSTALPNEYGNSNGLIPNFNASQSHGPRRMWFQRAAASVVPNSVLQRIGLAPQRPSGPVGGGTNNDGVFANVTAKPSPPVRVQDGDDTYLVPEETRNEAPPSYAAAQADAVPPYWETTIHAPFAPDSMGDMVIDSLPTGSLFSFCWNLLVSISFQFVGFLLTYLLHTSHAARLGSRAGLGVTLIQYGFALRNRIDNRENDVNGGWGETDSGSGSSMGGMTHVYTNNVTWSTPIGNMTEEQATAMVSDATTEWLSFFLMTVGWFVLLTSLLGFWRVKRWERGILASRAADNSTTTRPTSGGPIVSQLESSFGLRGMSRIELLRQGFGFGPSRRNNEEEDAGETTRMVVEAEEGRAQEAQRDPNGILALDPNHPRTGALLRALATERQLQNDLRQAGLL